MSSAKSFSEGKAKILIVDDHPVVRDGLTWLMREEPDVEVCGGAESTEEAMAQIRGTKPALVIVDLALKDGNGLNLIGQIRAQFPHIKTLVWSMFDDSVYAERAIRAGAMGYVNKQEPMETVLTAAREALRGNIFASAKTTDSLLRRLSGNDGGERDAIALLSDRELDVFRMIGRGKTTQEIAHQLGIKQSTVETHREKIKAKLNLKNATQLNARAIQWVVENG